MPKLIDLTALTEYDTKIKEYITNLIGEAQAVADSIINGDSDEE